VTTQAELEEFVEAPAAFTLRVPGTTAVSNERYTLLAHDTWLAVQRIRLRTEDVDDAVDAARSLMRVTGASYASWWLSDRSTPADVEERLLACGITPHPDEYLIDGMLLTTAPPPGPPHVLVRRVGSADERVAATLAQYEAFDTPPDRRRAEDELREEHELLAGSDASALYAAWCDGQLVAAARSFFSPRGVLLAGGGTVPNARGRGAYRALVRARWDDAVARGTPALAVQAGSMSAPILRRLGFLTVCWFRRLEDVASVQ
jgi:hypothetical protein